MISATIIVQIRPRLLFAVLGLFLATYVSLNYWFLLRKASMGRDKDSFPIPQRHDIVQHSRGYISEHSNTRVMFFNRVPKTGSEMLVLLMQWLQAPNTFRHVRLKNTIRRHMTLTEQLEFAAELGETVHRSGGQMLSFDRHVHFTNFTTLGLKMPIYLNMVRDPVEKLASRFYYRLVTPPLKAVTPSGYRRPLPARYTTLEACAADGGSECTFLTGHEYDLTIPYFCGHHQYCRELNHIGALESAKRHVEEWYSVVGVLEDFNATLNLLEHTLPQFFYGVTEVYYEDLGGIHYNKNRHKPQKISSRIEQNLRKNLSLEYDFYHFIKKRLYTQLALAQLS